MFGIDPINILRSVCAFFCDFAYRLIANLYDLFINISRVELLTSKEIHPIYQRITMILTIVMVFYVTFETVKFVIEPDKFTDKEKGASKIVIRMVAVVLLIAFVPQLFGGAYWVQNKIFDTQVFSKVILGKQNVDSSEFGKNLSYNVFSMFYQLETDAFTESELESQNNCGNLPCKQVVYMNYNQLQTEGKLTFLNEGLNEKGKTTDENTGETFETYYIRFNGIFAVIVGGFIAYMLLLYCIDAGVRVVQLLFLQIIAPIPIMAYLSPKKDGMFEKWTKQCITTYLDLFLRVGIIYFILLICQVLANAYNSGTLVNNVTGDGAWLVYIALIMGLLLFAHKMPKMLGELFPKMGAASGNFGLNTKDRGFAGATRVVGATTGATVGAVVGAATGIGQGLRRMKKLDKNATWYQKAGEGVFGATRGAIRGTLGGAARGMYNGSKKGNVLKNISSGTKNQIQANQKFGNREENGYTLGHQIEDRARGLVGARSRVDMEEEKKAPIKRYQDINEKINKANSDMNTEAESQVKKGKGKYSGELAAAEKNLQNIQESQTLRDDTKNVLRKSSEYATKCQLIEKDPNNQGKSNDELDKLKNDALEEMVNKNIAEQLTTAQKAVKTAKDKAIFDYITNGEYKGVDANGNDIYDTNARLESIRTALRTEMTEYNRYNTNSEYAINSSVVESAMLDGELMDSLINGKNVPIPERNEDGSIKLDAAGNVIYLNYNPKRDGVNNAIDTSKNKMVEITQKQESIKRETSGSGINEGKK